MGGVRKARVEGAAAERPSASFREGLEAFKASHPDLWDEIRLNPAQYAVEVIAEHLEKM